MLLMERLKAYVSKPKHMQGTQKVKIMDLEGSTGFSRGQAQNKNVFNRLIVEHGPKLTDALVTVCIIIVLTPQITTPPQFSLKETFF